MMRTDDYVFPLEEASGTVQRGLTVLEYAAIQVMAQMTGSAMGAAMARYWSDGTEVRFSAADLAREAWVAAQALINAQPR